MSNICEYGCGREAKFFLPTVKKWCCEKSSNSCPAIREKNSKGNCGKIRTKTHCENISRSLKGKTLVIIHGKEEADKIRKKLSKQASRSWIERYGEKKTKKMKQRMRTRFTGKQNPMFGKTHSSEVRMKISEINKRKIVSKETKKKISIANKGISKTEETIDKLKKALTYKIKDYKNKYPTFSKVEQMRYNPDKPGEKEIQVRCKNHNCQNSKEKNGWFTPTKVQLYERIRALETETGCGGSYLYCCYKCKQECPLYNLKSDPNKIKTKQYTSEEYNIWRAEVLKRAEHICEYCGEQATHTHHSRPQKLEPFFSLDPDYGIACCSECHYKYGHRDECSTGQLANRICS